MSYDLLLRSVSGIGPWCTPYAIPSLIVTMDIGTRSKEGSVHNCLMHWTLEYWD